MITKEQARARVAKGAALLDHARPNWFHEIDTGALSMESSCLCILGQIYRGYGRGLDRFCWSQEVDDRTYAIFSRDAGQAGFCLLPEDIDSDINGFTNSYFQQYDPPYHRLQDAWIEAIADRLHATPPATNAVDPQVEVLESGTRA